MKNFIKNIRESQDLTAAELAAKVGTTQQQITNLENGKRKLTWEWIKKLANALECHPLDITDGPGLMRLPISDQERDLLARFRGFSEEERRMFTHMLDTYSSEKSQITPKDEAGNKRKKTDER